MNSINDFVVASLKEAGGEGSTLNDIWNNYLTSLGYTTGSLQDRQKDYLNSLGYEGSLQDMLKSWYCEGVNQ